MGVNIKRNAQGIDIDFVDLLKELPSAVLVFDGGGYVQFANTAAESIFPNPSNASVATIMGQGHPVLSAMGRVMASGVSLTLHDVAVAHHVAQSVTVQPMGDTLFLMTLHMYSPHIKTEWMRKTRDALAPARLMARTLAHEIKNPLAGIQGAAQLLTQTVEGEDRELAALISHEAERILRLVRKVDIFEPLAPEQLVPVNIHEVLGHVVRVAQASFGVRVSLIEAYDPSLPEIAGDFDSLVQAVMNLVRNAVEAVPEDAGKIVLRTFYDVSAAVHPESLQKLPFCVEISDNGSGIDAMEMRRVFDPYYTTKAGGEGLGLSVVSRIIDDHGGAIDVSSDEDGTVFRLSFPMQRSVP